MITTDQPELLIFAGTNGSGKTTFALEYLRTGSVKSKIFLNADEIARGLSPLDPESQRVQAGKILLKTMEDHMAAGRSFAFETTLSGSAYMKRLEEARRWGYFIIMFYLYTSDPETNIERIRNRVREGGHNVPDADVKRRHTRSLAHLARNYWQKCDTIFIFNTDKGYNELACVKGVDGQIQVMNEDTALLRALKELDDEIAG